MSRSKYFTIYNWKKSGLIYDNYDELYEVYIKTMECQHCNKAFKKSSDRCLDHDHETGLFRKIVCNRCNTCDSYIKYPFGYSRQEYGKAYRQANKEKLKEYNQEKIKCDCGVVVSRGHIARHNRSIKHIEYLNSI